MSLLTDILVPLGAGAAVCLVIGLALRGILGGIIGVPVWLIAVFVVAAATLFFTPTNVLIGFWKFGREGFTFMECRKEGKICIGDLEVGTGNAEFVVGKKRDPKDPIFEDEQSGVKMDPTMVAAYADPLRFPMGLDIVFFGHDSLLPQNHRNHLAFKRIIDYIHTEPIMKELLFMTDKEVVELLKKPEHFLEADIKTKVGKYFKARKEGEGKEERIVYYREFQKDNKWFRQEILVNSDSDENPGLVQLIRRAKTDLEKLPILKNPDGEYFCMNEAFKYNPVSYTAQYASWLKNILQRMADMNALKLLNYWTYGLIAMGIIGVTCAGIVLGFKVLGMKVGGA